VETPRKFITARKFIYLLLCFHKQNYYIFYRHTNIQSFILVIQGVSKKNATEIKQAVVHHKRD
jgi:hypothetical protein